MPVSEFECQIARGQIGRYLDGGALSAGMMAGLESHLAECPGCKTLVAERRAALLGSLGGATPTRAVVSMPVENPLIAALRQKADEAEAPVAEEPSKTAPRYAEPSKKRSNLAKPLALAGLLAVVLIGMSRLTRSMTGPTAHADASFVATAVPPTPAPTPVVPAAIAPFIPKPRVPIPPKPLPKPVVVKPIFVAPKPVAARPVRRVARKPRAVRRPRPVAKRPVRRAPRTGVRVYGLDGRPLNP